MSTLIPVADAYAIAVDWNDDDDARPNFREWCARVEIRGTVHGTPDVYVADGLRPHGADFAVYYARHTEGRGHFQTVPIGKPPLRVLSL